MPERREGVVPALLMIGGRKRMPSQVKLATRYPVDERKRCGHGALKDARGVGLRRAPLAWGKTAAKRKSSDVLPVRQ